jgi:hypothetical protein
VGLYAAAFYLFLQKQKRAYGHIPIRKRRHKNSQCMREEVVIMAGRKECVLGVCWVCVFITGVYFVFITTGPIWVCVFITAVPITKLFAGGGVESGGHVLRETTSRGQCELVCPSRTGNRTQNSRVAGASPTVPRLGVPLK